MTSLMKLNTRKTSIPCSYSICRASISKHARSNWHTFQAVGKLSKIFSERKKIHRHEQDVYSHRWREKEKERWRRCSLAFIISLLWQPIRGQAALLLANHKRGLAVLVLLKLKTIGTDVSVRLALGWTLKGTHTHTHTNLPAKMKG